ncbi:MAG: hypothetical protein FJ387_29800 [Verrucomicrobia bacterium]|nr:hypothetical protein [Verrucomicrobiota bacterium]
MTNSSFEEPVLADGGFAASIPGWTLSAGSQSGVQNPSDSMFSGASAPGGGVPDGHQVAWMNMAGTVSQVLNATVQAGTEYTLAVSVGDRKDLGVGNYSVQLRAGDQVLGSASPPTVNDGFVTATVRYSALPGDPHLGKALEIVLAKSTTVHGEQVVFDKVVLAARTIGTPPTAPSGGLIAHWRFDEGSGRAARDATGRYDGELSAAGASFAAEGIAGGAVVLDRTQNGMVVMPSLGKALTNDFSVVAWARLPAGDTTPLTVLLGQHEAWHANGFFILMSQHGTLGAPGKATFVANDISHTATSTTAVNDGQWHQIVAVYGKAGQTAIYVDGAPAEAAIASGAMTDRSAPFIVGGLMGNRVAGVPDGYYTGWVDDIQVYSGALSDAQIDLIFRNPGSNLAQLEQAISIRPPGGEFAGSVEVSLTADTAGASLRYTLDGGEPGPGSLLYQTPFTLYETTTVKARLFVSEFPASAIATATFTKLPPMVFEPAGGRFTNAVQVTLLNLLGLGGLRFTTDGSEPLATSPLYSAPLTLTAATTLKARLYLNAFPISDIYTATFARVYALDDGIPNEWRERYFGPGYLTDPRVAPEADPDGDGWINRLEYQAGSDPTDPQSTPAVIARIRAVPLVSWNSIPGLTYRVLRKPSVNAPDWEIVLPAFQATATTSRYLDPDAPPTAIYQIEMVP